MSKSRKREAESVIFKRSAYKHHEKLLKLAQFFWSQKTGKFLSLLQWRSGVKHVGKCTVLSSDQT
uniref:Uncharacterized protein n=1 Tax=Anguilla anguilla TaxID=7936 RepID=A0A0E9THE0_ANGAN